TPIFDLGRSRTWPTDAFTVNPLPRYLPIVRALAGDSTTTRAEPGLTFLGFLAGSPCSASSSTSSSWTVLVSRPTGLSALAVLPAGGALAARVLARASPLPSDLPSDLPLDLALWPFEVDLAAGSLAAGLADFALACLAGGALRPFLSSLGLTASS